MPVNTATHYLTSFADEAGLALASLSASRAIVATNARFQSLLQAGDVFVIKNNALQPANPAAEPRFDAAFETQKPVTLALPGLGLSAPVSMRLIPLAENWCLLARRIVPDPMEHLVDVSAVYGLTKAEWRVCELLARGKSASDIAETLRLSVETVRTHRKRIYAKAEIEDRGALIALLSQYRI